jgi:nitrite reductase/ring-hydroxylating ferredoxin subunit
VAVPDRWSCPVTALAVGSTATFRLRCGRRVVEGFVVRHRAGLAAYANRCAHLGTPLDLWPNEFLSADGETLVCATHGALYHPLSGECLAGPCAGRGLVPLRVRVEGDQVVVECPEIPPGA